MEVRGNGNEQVIGICRESIIFVIFTVAEQVADTSQSFLGSPVKVELCYKQLGKENGWFYLGKTVYGCFWCKLR